MKFFIDTANLDQIREAQQLGVLDGVTTNPSLMAKEGITGRNNILKHYVDICEIVDGDVSAEVIATDFENIVKEGEELAEQCMRVDFPDPEGPMIAVNLPFSNSTVTSSRARTSVSSEP